MSKFRQIYTSFWKNPYIQEEMTAEDKYFYLYLLTNDQTKQIGVYQITKKQMSFDLGHSMESVNALVKRFEEQHKLIKYDINTKEMVILKWGGLNLNKGGKPIECLLEKEFKETKNKELIKLIMEDVENENIKEFLKSLFLKYDTCNDTYHDTSEDTPKNDKVNKINASYDTYHDTGGINNKEEIIKNKEERRSNKEEVQENLFRLNDNPMEQDLIYKEFMEQGISEEVGMLLIEFLEVRAASEKVKKSEVRFLLMELKGKYLDDETKIKALQYAIASRHKSLVYVPDNKKENKDSALSGISEEDLNYAVM